MSDETVAEVYWAATAQEAHLVKALLEDAGIEAHVVGEMLQTGVGELPAGPSTSPRVWVSREDEGRALAIIAEREGEVRDERERDGDTTTGLGREQEGLPDSGSSRARRRAIFLGALLLTAQAVLVIVWLAESGDAGTALVILALSAVWIAPLWLYIARLQGSAAHSSGAAHGQEERQ